MVYLTQQQTVLLTQSTFTTLVWLSMIPIALAVVVLIVGLQEVGKVQGGTDRRATLSLGAFDGRFRFVLFCVALFTLGNSADAFIVLLAQARGASVLTTLFMVLGFNAVYTIFAQPFGRLSDQVGRFRMILIGWVFYAAVYLGFALSDGIWQVALLWAFYGLYYAMVDGALRSLVADLTPPELRGTGYGWFNATVAIMALPASLVAGLLWQNVGPAAPFYWARRWRARRRCCLVCSIRGGQLCSESRFDNGAPKTEFLKETRFFCRPWLDLRKKRAKSSHISAQRPNQCADAPSIENNLLGAGGVSFERRAPTDCRCCPPARLAALLQRPGFFPPVCGARCGHVHGSKPGSISLWTDGPDAPQPPCECPCTRAR